MKKILYILLLALIIHISPSYGQEKLSPLQSNPAIREYVRTQKLKNERPTVKRNRTLLTLPFLDDFSKTGIFPDNSKWSDNDVFINNSFPKFPPSYGVATFDAINDTGTLYETASNFPFIADHLTSQFIDLSALHPSDSLYLSFFVQPQGMGNDPQPSDSLVLEFMEKYRADTTIDTTVTPHDTTYSDTWRHMWGMPGMALDTFLVKNKGHYFQLVMLRLDSLIFFRNDFRFRFLNYASLGSPNIPSWQSNCDQWHLDYVYLNSSRHFNDTTFNDLTFVNSAPSFTRPYQSMTSRQYCVNKTLWTKDSVRMQISNLSASAVNNSYYGWYVNDYNGNTIKTANGGFWTIDPYYSSGYQSFPAHAHPFLQNFQFPLLATDTTEYTITHYINRDVLGQEFIKQNDTIRFVQKFSNYLAYDDGIPEAGYGLSPAGAMLAYKFTLNAQDTLTALSMFFNRALDDANQKNFYLAVWADNGGKPGTLIYKNKTTTAPVFVNQLNVFHTYNFDNTTPIVLDNTRYTFYVGWMQTSDDNLNVGFDVNNDSRSSIFFNVGNGWENSGFTGSLLIRPVFGSKHKKISTGDHISIGPNPTNGPLNIILPPGFTTDDLLKSDVGIYNIIGERIHTPVLTDQQIDLSALANGVYILRITSSEKSLSFSDKLIIVK